MIKKLELFTGAAVIFLLMVSKYVGLRPPYHNYLIFYHKARFPDSFAHDISLFDSIYLKASVFYQFLFVSGLPIENDFIGLGLALVLNTLLAWGAFRVLREGFGLTDGGQAVAVLIAICFLHAKLVDGSFASLIEIHSSSPTGFAHIAGYMALFALLVGRFWLAGSLAILTLALAPKGNVTLVPIFLFFAILHRPYRLSTVLALLLPLGWIIFQIWQSLGGVHLAADEAARMTRLVLIREAEDASFLEQGWLSNAMLVACFVASPILIRQFTDAVVRKVAWAVLVVTAASYAFMLVYGWIGYQLMPIPELFMVSIPRATRFFTLIFFAMLMALVFRDTRLAWYQKVALGLATILIKPFPAQFVVAASVAGAGFVAPWVVRRVAILSFWPKQLVARVGRTSSVLVFAICTAIFVVSRLSITYVGPSWIDPLAYRNSGTWSADVWADQAAWDAWRSLAKIGPDFNFLSIYPQTREGIYGTHTYPNVIANKSFFAILPPNGYLNPSLWLEAQRRVSVTDIILQRLNAGHSLEGVVLNTVNATKEGVPIDINDSLEHFLSSRNVGVLVPAALAPLFPKGLPRRTVGSYVLMLFWTGPVPSLIF